MWSGPIASLASSLFATYADQFLQKKYLKQHKHSRSEFLQSFTPNSAWQRCPLPSSTSRNGSFSFRLSCPHSNRWLTNHDAAFVIDGALSQWNVDVRAASSTNAFKFQNLFAPNSTLDENKDAAPGCGECTKLHFF